MSTRTPDPRKGECVDLNIVVLNGRLAAPPELRTFDSGSRLVRFLVTTRTARPRRRVDVVPVTLWDPDESILDTFSAPGIRIWVAGSVQRRFWDADAGRRSRLEIVAHHVQLDFDQEGEEDACGE